MQRKIVPHLCRKVMPLCGGLALDPGVTAIRDLPIPTRNSKDNRHADFAQASHSVRVGRPHLGAVVTFNQRRLR